jgi:hypothetical protein
MIRQKGGIMIKRARHSDLNGHFLLVLFFLAAGGGIRGGAFLLSEAELVRIGSDVAYLDISWAKVGDLNPRAEIGPAML